ncbi:MAG: FRG domain-containing protein [Chloroflexi bacterium]|nr:FRG domain-containing protein [Chloroflexota bacterium]
MENRLKEEPAKEIRTVQIRTWENCEKEIAGKRYREWLFRGQSDAGWKLESSLDRLFRSTEDVIVTSGGQRRFARKRHERELLNTFKSQAHLYLDALPAEKEYLEWLSLMQHFGTPTRLLDMTFSPYVAEFFALESGSSECSICALPHRHFTDIDLKTFGGIQYRLNVLATHKDENTPSLFPYEPKKESEKHCCSTRPIPGFDH